MLNQDVIQSSASCLRQEERSEHAILWQNLNGLSLASGYWQVEMFPEDGSKTEFCTPEDLFKISF